MSAELNDGFFFSPHWTQICNPKNYDLSLKDYFTQVEGREEANQLLNVFSNSGSNCTGRIIEVGKMDY